MDLFIVNANSEFTVSVFENRDKISAAIVYGNGANFYKANLFLAELELLFKEEIVINFDNTNQYVSLRGVKKFNVAKNFVNYIDRRYGEYDKAISDLDNIERGCRNIALFEEMQRYIQSGEMTYHPRRGVKKNTITMNEIKDVNPSLASLKSIIGGLREKSIIINNSSYNCYKRILDCMNIHFAKKIIMIGDNPIIQSVLEDNNVNFLIYGKS